MSGTPAYMSPEQILGKHVGAQADIWSFGCLLYELLCAKHPFRGASMADTIRAALESEPDWTALPPQTPESVRFLLRRCLQKDRKKRFHDASDVVILLEESAAGAAVEVATPAKRLGNMGGWVLAAPVVAGVVLLAGALSRFSQPPAPPSQPTARFTITMPLGERMTNLRALSIAISPDGSQLVYVASSDGNQPQLYLRNMNSVGAKPLPSTEGADTPFFSADGKWIGFWSGRMKKLAPSGGPAVDLATWMAGRRGEITTRLCSRAPTGARF
jgi:serine/threonine protein kinase